MKKLMKVALVCAVVIASIGMSSSKAVAAELAVDGTLLTTDSESEFVYESMLRGAYLYKGTGTITNPGIGLVGAGGTTIATMSVPSISVSVSIQRYNGSGWTTVANWTTSASNTNYVGSSKTYSVTRGYYYRVYTVHAANGEYAFGATSGIYIS